MKTRAFVFAMTLAGCGSPNPFVGFYSGASDLSSQGNGNGPNGHAVGTQVEVFEGNSSDEIVLTSPDFANGELYVATVNGDIFTFVTGSQHNTSFTVNTGNAVNGGSGVIDGKGGLAFTLATSWASTPAQDPQAPPTVAYTMFGFSGTKN